MAPPPAPKSWKRNKFLPALVSAFCPYVLAVLERVARLLARWLAAWQEVGAIQCAESGNPINAFTQFNKNHTQATQEHKHTHMHADSFSPTQRATHAHTVTLTNMRGHNELGSYGTDKHKAKVRATVARLFGCFFTACSVPSLLLLLFLSQSRVSNCVSAELSCRRRTELS